MENKEKEEKERKGRKKKRKKETTKTNPAPQAALNIAEFPLWLVGLIDQRLELFTPLAEQAF